jgi:hypothetical protein
MPLRHCVTGSKRRPTQPAVIGVRGRSTRSLLTSGPGLSAADSGNRQLATIPTSPIKPTTHIAPNHSRSSTLSTPGDASENTTPTARILGNPLFVHVNRPLSRLPHALYYPPRTGAIPKERALQFNRCLSPSAEDTELDLVPPVIVFGVQDGVILSIIVDLFHQDPRDTTGHPYTRA